MQVDPTTGQPIEMEFNRKAMEAATNLERTLHNQARFLDTANSEAATALYELVVGELYKRVEKLTAEDPEARAYLSIIKTFNFKTSAARQAADKLMGKRHARQ